MGEAAAASPAPAPPAAPRHPLASTIAESVRRRIERLVELGVLPPSDVEREYAVRLLEEVRRLSLSDPDVEEEFARLLRRLSRDELGFEIPLERGLPPDRAVQRLLQWVEERLEELAERLGLTEAQGDEQDLADAVTGAVLGVVARAAERVLAWFEPRGGRGV